VHRNSRASIIPFALILVGLVALAMAATGSARAKPTCFGKTATIVGSNGSNKISGTPRNDVIYAGGGNDKIQTPSGPKNNGKDIICGGPGNDKIIGNADAEKISGGPGKDLVKSGNGNDLVVGDNENVSGNESGKTGNDSLDSAGGKDFIVGDNYARGDAKGASPDTQNGGLEGDADGDTIVGDSASFGSGDATGGADDRMGGAAGNDIVIGDSYTVSGVASGGGKDDNNSGPGADLAVGDSYTKTGSANTAGGPAIDELHAADGGDAGAKCKPANSCADVFYGDNYSAACGPAATLAAILCQNAHTSGGGHDLLNADQGNDFMNGGLPDPDGAGTSVDRCDGGDGIDTGTRCKGIQRGFEHTIPFPSA
jgi:RTX calcium-binding nonapeptide repeat (4 copies)